MNNVKTRDFKHVLPPLPYDYVALEPYIDARTMMLHRISITRRMSRN